MSYYYFANSLEKAWDLRPLDGKTIATKQLLFSASSLKNLLYFLFIISHQIFIWQPPLWALLRLLFYSFISFENMACKLLIKLPKIKFKLFWNNTFYFFYITNLGTLDVVGSCNGLVLGSCQFLLLPQPSQKIKSDQNSLALLV